MLEAYPAVFCEHCQQLLAFKADGQCPSCGEVCLVFPEQLRVEGLLNAELLRLRRQFLAEPCLKTRGGMELMVSDHEITRDVIETIRDLPPVSERDINDVVLVNELPKLDIVVLALTHLHSREEVRIHHGHYSDLHYGRGLTTSVPEPAACEHRLLDEVFAADLLPDGAPGFAETAPGPLLFCHLRPMLALLQAHNSLWYAALGSGFYPLLGYLDPGAPVRC